ncbi:unnamed protein product [Rotaria socialis]|uniref:DUF1275 domain-containing protein n=1 Tax=Rotaria socialis TaxID=392032 RepID=A0A820PDZ7_9BILA|nr:unnamed protein product [Rotaria socialis]CAF3542764.1 unnamed protein product [Rotaria socialis]CAF3738725.1 unnamed protein product [Rotaria socialis]CAF4405316.1 unnamed protein product [Rotaria socialis]CAF4476170.1 unnamed protein product [Rotaria socialis]
MRLAARRPTIVNPTIHIRSYNFGPFLVLIVTGCLLSFLAGYINTICIASLFQSSIAGFTGSTSRMVIELAQLNLGKTFYYILLIFSFIFGSFISAALIGGSSFRIQRSYGLVLVLESFALAFSYLCEESASRLKQNSSIYLYTGACLVAFTCGLQNGMCTTFSGAVIRTTHMTGVLTDIGLVLGQALFYPRTRKHLWKLKVLVPLYASFCCGGLSGWFAHKLLLIKSILLASAIVGVMGIGHVCYCKIYLMYTPKQISKKHLRRNLKKRLATPTIVVHGSANNIFNTKQNGIAKESIQEQQDDMVDTPEIQNLFN